MENKGERPGKLCGTPITFSLIYVVLHRSSYFFLIPGDGTSK